MSNIKRSVTTDKEGRATQVNYTEQRPDGKTKTRHYDVLENESQGRTVGDQNGHSEYYDKCNNQK